MFCRKCGAQIGDNASFCSKCGTPTGNTDTQKQGDAGQPQGGYQQQYAQQPYAQQPYGQQPYGQAFAPAPVLPMKWFKFLIYFSLFAGAVMNVVSGVMTMTGGHYEMYGDGMADRVYDQFPGLMTLDIACGVCTLICAVLALVARFRLAGYRKDGPGMLAALYIVGGVFNLAYLAGAYFILPEAVFNAIDATSYFTSFAISMAMASINIAYFKKRAALFVR